VRPRAKVTIDSLQEVVYEKSIGTKMNNLDPCSEVVQGHVNHCGVSGVNISKTAGARDFQVWYTALYGNWEMPSGRTNILSESAKVGMA